MDRQAILEEIVKFTLPPTREEDEFTLNEYRAECALAGADVSRKTASYRLERLIKKGILTKRLVLLESKWTTVYRKVDQNDKNLAGRAGGDPTTGL